MRDRWDRPAHGTVSMGVPPPASSTATGAPVNFEPGPIEAVHDRLRAVLATNRNLRRALDDEHAGPGEIAAAWTTADETILQAVTGQITEL